MRLPDGLLELDALSLDPEQRTALLFMDCRAQVIFECGHLVKQMANAVIHELLRSGRGSTVPASQ